uniref:Uncharacterized protein n=1 Tax=Magallana gigas TaxID=29159 RepID=K1Q7E0_MAGGI
MYDPEYPEDLGFTASPRFREKNRIDVRENEPQITVRRQQPLEAPTERDEGGYKNPDTSFKKPPNYIKSVTPGLKKFGWTTRKLQCLPK